MANVEHNITNVVVAYINNVWVPIAEVDIPTSFDISNTAGTEHPHRFLTKVWTNTDDGGNVTSTVDYIPLGSPAITRLSGSDIFNAVTDTIDIFAPDHTGANQYYTVAATKLVVKSGVGNNVTANYEINRDVSAGDDFGNTDLQIAVRAITENLTKIEVVYWTGSQWRTRDFTTSDETFSLPGVTTASWELPIRYVSHNIILATINNGASEDWDSPTQTDVPDNWNSHIDSVDLYSSSGSLIGTKNILRFVSKEWTFTAGTQTTIVLSTNPYIAGKDKTIVATSQAPVSIKTTVLRPANVNAAYTFTCEPTYAVQGAVWSATGLPSGYSINASTGVISASANESRSITNDLASCRPDVTLTYSYSSSAPNYMPATVSTTLPFRLYQLKVINGYSANNDNVLTPGTVNTAWTMLGGIVVIGDTTETTVRNYYNSYPPSNWTDATAWADASISTLYADPFLDGHNGIDVRVPNGFKQAVNFPTTVSIPITQIANSNPLPLPSGDSSFTLSRTFTIPISASSYDFVITPTTIKTKQGTIIGVSAHQTGSSFFNPDSRYSINCDPVGGNGAPLFDNPATTTLNDYDYIWIPLRASITNGVYKLRFSREGVSKTIDVTIDNTIDLNASISNITYSGYSGSYPLTYKFYGNSNPSTFPADRAQTFSVTVANLSPSAGYFTLTVPNGSDVLNYLELCTGDASGSPAVGGNAFGNSCGLRIKPAINTPLPTGYFKTVILNFVHFADGSASTVRIANIEVRDKRTTINIDPTTFPAGATQGQLLTPQVYTASGGVGPYTWSWPQATTNTLAAWGLSFTPNPSDSTKCSLGGTPTNNGALSLVLNVQDSLGNTGTVTLSGTVSPSAGALTITSASPLSWNGTTDSVTFTVVGENFTTQANQTGITLDLTTNTGWPSFYRNVTATLISGTTYNASVSIPAGTLSPGTYNLYVDRLAAPVGAATYSGVITITSPNNVQITTVAPSTARAGESVSQFILTGSGFGNSPTGTIIFTDASGAITNIPATVSNNGSTATATQALASVGIQGSAYVKFKTSANAFSNTVTFPVTAAGLGNVVLTHVTGGSTQYTGSTNANSPTEISVQRAISQTFTLSCSGGTTGTYVYTLDGGTSLPADLVLSSGTISGTVQSSSVTTTFAIKVQNGSDSKVVYFRFKLTGGAVSCSPQTFTVRKGQSGVSLQIAASGGSGVYTFTQTGTLPSSLTMSSSGLITGTVSGSASSGTIQVAVVDSLGVSAPGTTTITITVLDALSNPTISSISPTSGALSGGTLVTLNVSGVVAGFEVYFGSKKSTTTGGNPTSGVITAVSPAGDGLGTVSVTVKNTTDNQVSPGVNYAYVNIVAPVFTALSLRDGPFAGGQEITVTGREFSPTITIKIDGVVCGPWTGASTIYVDSTTARITTPPYSKTIEPDTYYDVPIELANSNMTTIVAAVDGYTYRPAPVIASVVPPTGPSSGNTTIYITGKNFFERGTKKPRVFIGNVEIDPTKITLVY